VLKQGKDNLQQRQSLLLEAWQEVLRRDSRKIKALNIHLFFLHKMKE